MRRSSSRRRPAKCGSSACHRIAAPLLPGSGKWRRRRRRFRSPGFRWPISNSSRARERVTLRALLEELRAAGLELVAEAPFDQLQDRRRSIEEVNIAGLGLARLTIHQLPSAEVPELMKTVVDAAAGGRRDSRVRAAAAPRECRRCRRPATTMSSAWRWPGSSWRTFLRSRSTGRSTVRSWRRWR